MEHAFNLLLALLEGFALIISPCILPILPIMLSASISGNRTRPYGIITGFVVTFTVFTLFSRALFQLLPISPDVLRYISFALLLLLGLIMFSETLSEKFNLVTSKLLTSNNKYETETGTQGGFFSGFMFGMLVGILWTPCAGPILAAIIVQVIIQKTTLASFFTVVAFAIGAGLPMILIALLGRGIMGRFSFFRHHAVLVRKILALIIIASVIVMMFVPIDFFMPQVSNSNVEYKNELINGIANPYPAPPISNISAWINATPLTLEGLKGKVVLIDFWTYSCINCIRTLPYLKAWYAKYHHLGFEIIGVHSPEFLFEHDLDNVKRAVAKMGINYPVALDNRFATWQNFKNQYWPAHYLIDKEGKVVYEHVGEGEYGTTENNIRFLLNLKPMQKQVGSELNIEKMEKLTPETYLGFARADHFASPETVVDNKPARYTYPSELRMNEWALQGNWIIQSDKIVADSPGASIKLNFYASKVYAVMSAPESVQVQVILNGKPLLNQPGSDVKNGVITVAESTLFTIVNGDKQQGGMLELVAEPGLEIYTFTFG